MAPIRTRQWSGSWRSGAARTALESLAEEERRLPPWLGEDPVSPRPTSDYQDLGEGGPDGDEYGTIIADEAGGDGAAPEGP